MALSPARTLACDVITRVRQRDAYAHETLSAALSHHHLSAPDAAFATRLAYGTIACRGTLDEIVTAQLSRPKSTDPVVIDALALSAWELYFSDTVSYAIVDQGVELIHTLKGPRYRSLANALLRRLAGARAAFPFADPRTDPAAHARQHGHPVWLARYLRARFGFDTADCLMAVNNEPAPLYLAHLPFSTDFDEVMARLEDQRARPVLGPVPGCIEIGVPSAVVASPLLSSRDVVVIDAAAQQCVALARAQAGQSLVEIGSGRGTKTLLLAANARRGGGPAKVRGIDLHEFKTNVLSADAKRLGAWEVDALSADVTQRDFIDWAAAHNLTEADTVFIDAPCSGLGTLRRHPDKRWRLQQADIGRAAQLGSALLQTAARLLHSDGMLIYATCTISAEENEDQIADFLSSELGSQFESQPVVNSELPPTFADALTKRGQFQTLPTHHGPDGHFCARLKKKRAG
ncbi:MAG: antitermination protein NusB [Actinomycetes bacterium]|jgi:16S rRNA (cytosine967-C5)-methyltransferase|nr:antitermination protein NusB [Actinomycetes bacterium]